MKRAILVAVVVFVCAAFALGEQPELSLSYLYQGSQPVPANSWFGMNGGRAEIKLPVNAGFSLVGEVAGLHAGSYGSLAVPVTLLTFMVGPRYTFFSNGETNKKKVQPFAQFLVGAAHATQGLYPTATGVNTTASSVALAFGGGLQTRLTRRVSLRLLQFDYLYTHLPNGTDHFQNDFRLGAGVTFRLR